MLKITLGVDFARTKCREWYFKENVQRKADRTCVDGKIILVQLDLGMKVFVGV